jgi:protein tyrosine phosphatase (PTP) superfamily phosphohydrolase (DUF442 family)
MTEFTSGQASPAATGPAGSVAEKLAAILPANDRPRPALDTRRARFDRYVNMLFVDHAFIRLLYKNMHPVSDRMYRSSQPTPGHLAEAARMGIRTVINLRGRRDDCGSWVLEDRACRELGLTLVDFPVNSRDAPKKLNLHRARAIWDSIEYPALMHCKAGSDRVGFMSALYLLVHEQRPLSEAMGQLSLKYGHVRQAKTGILDHFYESFAAHTAGFDRPVTVEDFYQWLDEVYDPPAMKSQFMATWWASTLVDRILRRE